MFIYLFNHNMSEVSPGSKVKDVRKVHLMPLMQTTIATDRRDNKNYPSQFDRYSHKEHDVIILNTLTKMGLTLYTLTEMALTLYTLRSINPQHFN